MRKYARSGAIILTLLVMRAGPAIQAQSQQVTEHVIINTPRPYANVVAAIQNLGGKVKQQFEYIDAISVDVPSGAMPAVRDLVGEDAISKDHIVRAPKPVKLPHKNVSKLSDSDFYTSVPVGPAVGPIFPLKSAANAPAEKAYAVNEANVKLRDLHAAGYTGKGIVVAVIDSGVKPGFASLDAGGSVIGGQDFVGDGNSFSSPSNDPHGTFVASLISGNARFPVPATSSTFISSMASNFPGTLESTAAGRYVDVIGSAPEAKIFALRIFAPNFTTRQSTLIAALESVIKLRESFDKFGQYSAANSRGGFNIKVCNMSLGASTTFAGHTVLEQLVDTMLAKDIVPVVAAGDAGSSSLTISSPATSFSALAVGATSPAANERLLYDVLFGTGSGALDRPTTHTQTAYFSSRGPAADGRILPNVMAAGYNMLSQGCGGFDSQGNCANHVNSLDMGNGTSFSAPVVAGVVAVLRQEFPKASAGQIWNAIVNGADDKQLGDDSTVLDQGQGVVNATAAANLLQSGKLSDRLPAPQTKPDSLVSNNIERNTDLKVLSGSVKQQFRNLKPGERGELLYQIDPMTSQVTVNITNVKLAADGNQFYGGDDVFLMVQTAKTSSGGFGDYFPCPPRFVFEDTSFQIPDPSCPFPEVLEPGVMRITLMGDSINAGLASANVGVTSSRSPLPNTAADGKIRGGDTLSFAIVVPAGVSAAQFQLRWDQDWAHYPTSDLDMHLYDPSGKEYLTPDSNGVAHAPGATLSSPESAIINNPAPGTWQVKVIGFYVPVRNDNFGLSVLLDGKPVQKRRNGNQE